MVDPVTTAAIGWNFAAAGWLISPVLTRFLNKCFDALGIDPPPKFRSRKQTLIAKLDNLQTTLLPQLLILTDATQQSPHSPFLEKWLQKLKSAFYEAEHVLGLVEYEQLEKKVNCLFPLNSNFSWKNPKTNLLKFSSQKKNLIKSLENLEDIVNEAVKFIDLLKLPSSNVAIPAWKSIQPNRVTIADPGCTVIGWDEEMKHLVQLLRKDPPESSRNTECYSVIGIWGMAGLGKTTLAQYVCEYEKNVKYFDLVIWIYVSENFNVWAIMRSMWESISGSSCPAYENLNVLISQVGGLLRGKRYLMVLDDVWCNKGVNEQQLNQLFVPLRNGKRGSKIMVTTRNEEAARTLGAMYLIKLPELADEDLLSLFMNHALRDTQLNEHLEEKLRSIGEKIVEKLCRLPLAAIVVAGQLRRRPDPAFWSSMLNKNFLKDVMGVLLLSYQQLSPPLQRCFAFCSLFPKGKNFEPDDLINLWIAEGFIEIEESYEPMKDIGSQYISELISSSFFEVSKWDRNNFSMHDLMHDLAHYVSGGEYYRIESGERKEIPICTRHIYVENHMFREYVENMCKLKDVRTIIVSGDDIGYHLEQQYLNALFMKLKKLYVVHIAGVEVERVSKSIIQLKNLRYLYFSDIEEKVNWKLMNRLYQLRILRTEYRQIPNVGRLILLQDLKTYYVRSERGFELKQLEHLKDLLGSLEICGLQHVKSEEEADTAKLSDKKGLRSLTFHWYYEGDFLRDVDVEILQGFCPPPQIKELDITGYSGTRFPSWISENNSNIVNLKKFTLSDCRHLEALAGINELSDLLSLTICSLHRLKSWEPLPQNLTQLKISDCFSLAFVLKEDLDMIMSTRGRRISHIATFMENDCLFKVFLYNYWSTEFHFECVKKMMELGHHIDVQELSSISNDLKKCLEKRIDLICKVTNVYSELYLPAVLEELSIKACFITDKVLAVSLQGLISLTRLELIDIVTITSIPKQVLSSLINLCVLEITTCLFLTSIGGWDTHSTLKELQIKCCPNLTFETSSEITSSSSWRNIGIGILKRVVVNIHNTTAALTSSSSSSTDERKAMPCNLKQVRIECCMPLDNMLHNLVSLQTLELRNCPTRKDLCVGQLKLLVDLTILSCPNLESLKGLGELRNLSSLAVAECLKLAQHSDADKLPQLKELSISNCHCSNNLSQKKGFLLYKH